MADIWVIGGGAIGAAAAVRLAQAGRNVGLIDPGLEEERASFGNAGQICPELAEPMASWAVARSAFRRLYAFGGPLDFRWSDIGLWGPWALRYLAACRSDRFRAGTAALGALHQRTVPAWRELADSIGRPDLIVDKPHTNLWESPARVAAGLHEMAETDLGPASFRPLTPDETARICGFLGNLPKGGARLVGPVKLSDPGEAMRALHVALRALGAEIRIGKVARLEPRADDAVLHLEDGGQLVAPQVLVAGGAWSAPLMRQAGMKAPLVSERGYHIAYADHDWPDDIGPVVFEERGVFLTCHTSGVRMTSFTEIGRPDAPPDPRKWAALERFVRKLNLPVRGEPRRWMGRRPSLPDFLPAIGRKGPVLYAFGHQHIGMTLAATTAEAVVELSQSNATPERLKAFALERFG